MPDQPVTIGPYRIIAKLGAGGMATVYRAIQPALQREVALKVVSSQFSGDPAFSERFLREARAGALVNHPNVVTCFDAGNADGQLYLAMELVTGGDLAHLLDQRGGRLDETLALTIMRDAASGLEAIEAAKLVHRDLKPANIFLDSRGAAKLADLGLVCFVGDDRLTKPGTVMGTPAYIAPEQARGVPDVDIRADIYSLGATLFHLVTGRPPFMSESPITTLVKSLNEPLPDPRSLRPDLSAGIVALIVRATGKDRATRHASARQLREDCERLLAGPAPAVTKPAGTAKPSAPAAATTPRATAAVTSAAKPAANPAARMNVEQLQSLTKRIVVDHDGLKASLVLAPGATFPRFLLEQVLITAGVVHGLAQEAINEATRASSLPRRIIVARGDAPSPGAVGTSVRGEPVPGLDAAVVIVIDDDGMGAVALTRPGALLTKEQLEPVLRASGLRSGIIPLALHRLCEGPADPSGRIVIARGTPARPGIPAGFRLEPAVMNTSADDLGATRNLQRVQPGTVLAHWQDAHPGSDGKDVFGRTHPAKTPPDPLPTDCVGEGTELGRDRGGALILRATRSGLCQQQERSAIRVVGAVEVAGDLGPDSAPITTEDVVVVRGNVLAGASISSSSDVVILGDLSDARVVTGGSLEVAGAIGPGDQALIAAGTVTAGSMRVRRVMAGSLRIAGEVRNCELLASGDISVGKVIGGCLTAGGSVEVGVAGDKDGTTTELWAGHNLSYAQQNELAKLDEARIDAERSRLVFECRSVEADYNDAQRKNQRLASSQFVRKDSREESQNRLGQLERNRKVLSLASEESRKQLAKSREVTRELKGLGDNAGAAVQATIIAHPGVVARLADVEPETLNEPRLRYRLGTTAAGPSATDQPPT